MITYGGVEEYLHAFLISVLDVGYCSASRHGRFTHGKIPAVPNG
jgi:hypothetical protein